VEHRVNPNLTVFGRVARSFRVPNVDERIGMVTSENGAPATFDLRTQKSRDLETGVRVHLGALDVQSSVYDMRLTDEIHFRFGPNFEANNINLDPTRRYGWETMASPTRVPCSAMVCSQVTTSRWSRAGPAMSA
jgi:iron complex outermembrane receptor protein